MGKRLLYIPVSGKGQVEISEKLQNTYREEGSKYDGCRAPIYN